MFVRIKTTPNSPRRSVQLVEAVRDGGRVRQRIVRHIGVAMDEDELERLRQLGEYVKAKLEDDRQPLLFAPEKIAEQVIRVGRQGDGKQELPVDLKQLEEEQRLITGVHEVYGEMYRLLGLDGLLPRSRYRASHDALFHVVMARIANPDSKRGSVRRLEEDFGVSLPLEKVYRMMDQLDAKAINHLRTRVGEASRSLLPEPVAILFFDCTTLYFETAVEDKLRQHGFSKDGKHRDSQVLLALMVTREGLPISYEVFPGATYEGHSLVPVLQDMQRRHQVERTVCVADRGMLSAENLDAMDDIGGEYVVGARLRKLPRALHKQILDPGTYAPLEGSENRRVGEWEHKGRRLIVVFCPERARKDAYERSKQVERLLDKLARSDNPKELLSNHGAKRFIAVEGDARLTVNPEKIAEAERWDGLAGVITNLRDASVTEVMAHYHGLWQVEESFRITKHDLRVRPIWHWNSNRIRAHIAIAFMAFACVRHLAYRVAIQKRRMSPEVIRSALVHRQCSVLRCRKSDNRYVIPSKPTPAAEQIYATMGLIGLKDDFLHDTGAFIPYGIAVAQVSSTSIAGPYRIPSFRVTFRPVYMPAVQVTPYRGCGRPHACYAIERAMDQLAGELGLDRFEVRRRNFIGKDEFPYPREGVIFADGLQVIHDSGAYEEALNRLSEAIDVEGFRAEQAAARGEGRYLGLGLGFYVEGTGLGPYEGGHIKIHPITGKVYVNTGLTDQGQGHETVFAQIAAEQTGVRVEDVIVVEGDTGAFGWGVATFASRAAVCSGNAIHMAAVKARAQIVEAAANMMECSQADIELHDGAAWVKGTDRRATLAEIATATNPLRYAFNKPSASATQFAPASRHDGPQLAEGRTPGIETTDYYSPPHATWAFGAHAAVIEVDPELCTVDVKRYVCIHDCGRMINPMIVDGQVMGGIAQGVGGAFYERCEFDEEGTPLNASFMDFLIPYATEVPNAEIVHSETPSPLNPLGVKGVGEAGTIPVAQVYASAVEDALQPFGIAPIREAPLTPDAIHRMLKQARDS